MRLLIIEDDPALGQVLVRGLVEEGYAVDLETTSMGARHMVTENEYDALILDLGLPDGDGITLCRSLRDSGVTMPILILTARDGLSQKVAGLDAGADDYVTKPFDFPELAARTRALLRRPGGQAPTLLSVGDVDLDPATHRVWRGAIAVPLTAREFALLHELMRHRDEVLSRSQLLEHVWDANYDGLSNVVDVHIANLRRKLSVPGTSDPIETVRGVGYRLSVDEPVDSVGT